MAKYVGKRILPLPCGEWDQRKEYEMLSVVLESSSGDSYIARRQVPAGTAITDTSYWAKSSDFSQQLQNVSDQLTETLRAVRADNDATEAAITADNDATEQTITQDIALNVPVFSDGKLYPNEGPGFGIELNEEFIATHITEGKQTVTVGELVGV